MNLRNITVTEIGSAVTVYSEKGRSDRMTDRKFYGLSFCISGEIVYVQNGCEYKSDKSCAVILPKGGTYSIKRNKVGYFPVINFDCIEPLCDKITVIPINNTEELLADYERIKKLFFLDGSRAQMFSILYSIFHKLNSERTPRNVAEAVKLIKSNYYKPTLTNEWLAAECNISEVYLRKLFLKHLSTSPKQFIIDTRLQMAKQLLSEGVYSISAIAEMCGFSNQYHFSRLFKQHSGITPSEYRRVNIIYEI